MSGMTLAEFLLARIAEDDERARDVWRLRIGAPIEYRAKAFDGGRRVFEGRDWETGERFELEQDEFTARFMERADPKARLLAECEAKRRIVERFAGSHPHPEEGCGCYESPDGHWAQVEAAATLVDLAAIYADHPDYDQEWRP